MPRVVSSDVSDELVRQLIPGTSGTVSRVTGGIFPVFADEGGERSAPQEHDGHIDARWRRGPSPQRRDEQQTQSHPFTAAALDASDASQRRAPPDRAAAMTELTPRIRLGAEFEGAPCEAFDGASMNLAFPPAHIGPQGASWPNRGLATPILPMQFASQPFVEHERCGSSIFLPACLAGV